MPINPLHQATTLAPRQDLAAMAFPQRLAVALAVSSDVLLFDYDERGPDKELRYQFETVRQFDPDDKPVAKAVLDGLILKNQAKRLAS